MTLTKSHVAGPTTPAVREMTFGDLLRQAAEAAPDRLALIAGVPDPKLRRQWTYAQFYREAQRTARALLSRFQAGRAHCRLGTEPAGMGDARIRRRHGGHDPRYREPGLSRTRSWSMC